MTHGDDLFLLIAFVIALAAIFAVGAAIADRFDKHS